jgi:hypothetical protein
VPSRETLICLRVAPEGGFTRQSTRIARISLLGAGNTRMDTGKMTEAQKTAIRSLEKALALLRSVQTLEGTDKDGVEHLLTMALEALRVDK